jgi:hypothetical protein
MGTYWMFSSRIVHKLCLDIFLAPPGNKDRGHCSITDSLRTHVLGCHLFFTYRYHRRSSLET